MTAPISYADIPERCPQCDRLLGYQDRRLKLSLNAVFALLLGSTLLFCLCAYLTWSFVTIGLDARRDEERVGWQLRISLAVAVVALLGVVRWVSWYPRVVRLHCRQCRWSGEFKIVETGGFPHSVSLDEDE